MAEIGPNRLRKFEVKAFDLKSVKVYGQYVKEKKKITSSSNIPFQVVTPAAEMFWTIADAVGTSDKTYNRIKELANKYSQYL